MVLPAFRLILLFPVRRVLVTDLDDQVILAIFIWRHRRWEGANRHAGRADQHRDTFMDEAVNALKGLVDWISPPVLRRKHRRTSHRTWAAQTDR